MTVYRRFAAIGSGLSASPAATSEPFVPQPALIGAQPMLYMYSTCCVSLALPRASLPRSHGAGDAVCGHVGAWLPAITIQAAS